MKYAVCIGINDYPGTGADLNGCVNDALGWSTVLQSEGYDTTVLLDSEATKTNVAAAIIAMVARARYRDTIVLTFSGHGSWVPDADGDEADGRDEVLVLHDYDRDGILSDDEIDRLFSHRRFGVRPIILSDSCHSGTVHRVFGGGTVRTAGQRTLPRFLPPEHFLTSAQIKVADRLAIKAPAPSRPTTALISGCKDDEFSYDAWIDGRFAGAFSHYALATYDRGQRLDHWHQRIRAHLPSTRLPQTPMLNATYLQKRWSL